MTACRFSVIVPFLDEEAHLEACIEALLHQSIPEERYELIFIDNGSRDRSAAIVSSYPRIKVLRCEPPNVYAARNAGLAAADGDIIAFTDADCRVAPDWLARIDEGFERSGARIALGPVSFPDGASALLKAQQDLQNSQIEYLLSNPALKERYYGYTNNMAVRRSVFEELGPFKVWPVPGDTELVLQTARRSDTPQVVFLEHMKATHLEITGFHRWLAKMFIYGRHNSLIPRTRLGRSEYFNILRWCASKHGYTRVERAVLVCSMLSAHTAYAAGMLSARIRSAARSA